MVKPEELAVLVELQELRGLLLLLVRVLHQWQEL
jgi:hypothetical protein